MALLAQHGYGKGTKLGEGIGDRSLDGVVFAARNERPENLVTCIGELRTRRQDCLLMLDPQFYLCMLPNAKDGYLSSHYASYYRPRRPLRDFVGPANLRAHAERTIDAQLHFNLDRVLSPTVIIESFGSRSYDLALALAAASFEYHSTLGESPPLLISFAIRDSAVADMDRVEQFLNDITSFGYRGGYFIPVREDGSKWPRWEGSRLARWMYMTYVLTRINDWECVSGYVDWCGLPLRAAGSTGIATGWKTTQKCFRVSSFTDDRTGGRAPRLRYSSGPLVNDILFSELQSAEARGVRNIRSDVPLDSEIGRWNMTISERHHWQVLRALVNQLGDDIAINLEIVDQWIVTATARYRDLDASMINLEAGSQGLHLAQWRHALREFRTLAELES